MSSLKLVPEDHPRREEPPNLWTVLRLFCYTFCPPLPSCIVRKMAFHPQKRGAHYVIQTLPAGKFVKKISKIGNEAFCLQPQLNSPNYAFRKVLLRKLKTWILHTSQGSRIIAVRAQPEAIHARKVSNVVVIFSQPNSSDIGIFNYPDMVNLQVLANILQVDVYAYDYSGFGYSSGTPSEANIYADLRAVYQHVRNEEPKKKIVLMGFSMGTATSTDLASENPDGLAGVILIAPFTSAIRLIKQLPEAPKTNCFDKFTTIDKISKVLVPILLIHGTKDEMISMAHAEILHRACLMPEKIFYVEGANHATVFSRRYAETFAAMWLFVNTRVSPPRESERAALISTVTVTSVLNRVRLVFWDETIGRQNLEASKSEV